jgi:hypothetical protein
MDTEIGCRYVLTLIMERVTIRLPRELLSRAKRKAAAEHRALTSLIEEGLKLVVSGSRKKSAVRRILPRCSDAVGGPYPGIDISDSAALQEMDDLEYAERLKNGFK